VLDLASEDTEYNRVDSSFRLRPLLSDNNIRFHPFQTGHMGRRLTDLTSRVLTRKLESFTLVAPESWPEREQSILPSENRHLDAEMTGLRVSIKTIPEHHSLESSWTLMNLIL